MDGARLVAAVAASAVFLTAPALYVYIVNSSIEPWLLWRRLRVLLFCSLSALSLLALLLGLIDYEALGLGALALAAAYLAIGVKLRASSSPLVVGLGSEAIHIRVLRGPGGVLAFSFTGDSSIYVSQQLLYSMPPEELLAIIAHEKGHAEALKPLTPLVANIILVLDSVALLSGVLSWAGEGLAELLVGALAIVASWTIWVTYNWSWETLADLYSLSRTGIAAYTALQRITAATPRPLTIREAYRELARSLRPRRVRGGLFFVNPHPSPATRLYVLQRVMQDHGVLLG